LAVEVAPVVVVLAEAATAMAMAAVALGLSYWDLSRSDWWHWPLHWAAL
jgi:hypothetical protein